MKKVLYKITWGLVIGVPLLAFLNTVYPVFYVSGYFYMGIFYGGLVFLGLAVTPFVIDFFILRKHVYNHIAVGAVLNVLHLWILNDYMPHFYLKTGRISDLVLFALVSAAYIQVAYKISKKV